MFQDFAKKKFDDYLALLDFPAGRIHLNSLRASNLPPFIISFFDYYVTKKNIPLDKKDFEEILNKAIVFNINYIIKPRNTILKFLFGEVETRPVHFIKERLKYFQFYGYYITHIVDFINVNSLEVVSSNQVAYLIDEINKKLYEEITLPGGEQQRMSLVKLLYYFFHDLSDNNPINIKIPQKILSVYFYDKGYYDIKKRVDGFFSDEIFIQEAIELMDPETKKSQTMKSDVNVSDDELKEIVTKAKSKLSKDKPAEEEKKEVIIEDNSVIIEYNSNDIPEDNSIKKKHEEIIIPDETITDETITSAAETPGEPEPDIPVSVSPVNETIITEKSSDAEVGKLLKSEDELPAEIPEVNIKLIREQEAQLPELEKSRLVVSEEIYSDDLMFASQFSDLTPPVQLTEKEIRAKLIADLFCEESHRRKIIKHIFSKDESLFSSSVNIILDKKSWAEAIPAIEELFSRNRVNYFSREAVKFVDIMQSHFVKEPLMTGKKEGKAG